MSKVKIQNKDMEWEEASIFFKNVWYRVEGESEEQNTYMHITKDVEEENIAYRCVNHLQFKSSRWDNLDFSKYPLKVIFGYCREVNHSMEHWFSYVFEGYATSTPYYDDDSLVMMDEDIHNKDYVPPSDALIARAEEYGWLWCPDEEVFEDEFYKSMDFEGLGGSVYLSDGVYINRTTVPLKDIEKFLDECDVLNES